MRGDRFCVILLHFHFSTKINLTTNSYVQCTVYIRTVSYVSSNIIIIIKEKEIDNNIIINFSPTNKQTNKRTITICQCLQSFFVHNKLCEHRAELYSKICFRIVGARVLEIKYSTVNSKAQRVC